MKKTVIISGDSQQSDVSDSTRVIQTKDMFHRDAEIRLQVDAGNCGLELFGLAPF